MKVEIKEEIFNPVTITLETKKEYDFFINSLIFFTGRCSLIESPTVDFAEHLIGELQHKVEGY